MKKIILLGLLIAVLCGGTFGYYLYNKPHDDMSSKKPDFELSAAELFADYEGDENAANTKYLDKVVQVSGIVQDVKTNDEGITSVTIESGDLMFGVICQLDQFSEHERTTFEIGEQVVFKGLCTGKLMDVVLVRCIEV